MASEVYGRYELEQVLGISRTRLVQLLRDDPEFPAPRWKLKMGAAWDGDDIARYADLRGRTLHPLGASSDT